MRCITLWVLKEMHSEVRDVKGREKRRELLFFFHHAERVYLSSFFFFSILSPSRGLFQVPY